MRKLVIALGLGFNLLIGLHPANAEIVVSFAGAPGAGAVTATISGSDVTTNAKPGVQIIAGNTPNFIDAAPGSILAPGVAASCSVDTLPSAAHDLSMHVVAGAPDGVDGVDSVSIDSASMINPTVGSTVTCNGTFHVPVDITSIALPADVTFESAALGITVRFTKAQIAAPRATETNIPSVSETLGSQQRAASTTVMNYQSNTLGDNLFGRLGNAFDRRSARPKVSANGISASTTGVSNWVDKAEQKRLKRQLASLPKDKNGNAVVVKPSASLFPVVERPWNAWIQGSWNFYDGDGSSFDGYSVDVLTGIDYKVSSNVIVGLMGGYGNTDFDTVTGGTKGTFSADGYTVGPYGVVKLSEHMQFNGLIAYTYSDYQNRLDSTQGDLTADRVTVGAQLKGTWASNGFFAEPGVRLLYAEEDQSAYTDSAGVKHNSLTDKTGRVSVGPKFGYTYSFQNGTSLKPWASVLGEYDFSNQGDNPTGGLPDLDDILSARTTAGLEATTADGLDVKIQGDVSGLGGGEYTGYGASARIGLPF